LSRFVHADANSKGPPLLRGGPSVELPMERMNSGSSARYFLPSLLSRI
jgi:hypothetical protein